MEEQEGPRRNFIRQEEDFTCEHCGAHVEGNGYTNHCPRCLHSKHVDAAVPGDRAGECQGLMEPISVEHQRGRYVIVHSCLACGRITRSRAAREDDIEAMLKVARDRGFSL